MNLAFPTVSVRIERGISCGYMTHARRIVLVLEVGARKVTAIHRSTHTYRPDQLVCCYFMPGLSRDVYARRVAWLRIWKLRTDVASLVDHFPACPPCGIVAAADARSRHVRQQGRIEA